MQLSIVSYLDKAATTRVRSLQQTLSSITGSVASLNSWLPHITISDGIELPKDELAKFIDSLHTTLSMRPFAVELSGFGSMDARPIGTGEASTPYAIFIDVLVSEQLLDLEHRIAVLTHDYPKWYTMPKPYLPHVTLAFRDLTKEGYEAGLNYVHNLSINLTVTIDHVALVEKLPSVDQELLRIQLPQ